MWKIVHAMAAGPAAIAVLSAASTAPAWAGDVAVEELTITHEALELPATPEAGRLPLATAPAGEESAVKPSLPTHDPEWKYVPVRRH